MNPNYLYTFAYALQAVVAICSISYFTDRLTSVKKKIVGYTVIGCLGMAMLCSFEAKEIELSNAATSENQARKKNESLLLLSEEQKVMLVSANDKLSRIEKALNAEGLKWDPATEKIIYNNSKNVISNDQKGGQTGFNINNH